MNTMELHAVAAFLDELLERTAFRDASANGVQVENRCAIDKIGLAVDACREAIEKAAAQKCNLLIVHHGLFWGDQQLALDPHYGRIRALIEADMALYAAHLPLDAHPQLGHNAQIACVLGLIRPEPFAPWHGKPIGIRGTLAQPAPLNELAPFLSEKIGGCQGVFTYGPETVQTVAIIAGSATEAALYRELKRKGIDLFISGEPKHGARYMARELGLNVFFGGHYQTETFGMKALAAHLSERLHLPAVFIDTPCDPDACC